MLAALVMVVAWSSQGPPARAQQSSELHEGWNKVEWESEAVDGLPELLAALDGASSAEWLAVAAFEGGLWRQAFAWSPFTALNTLRALESGQDYWLFTPADGSFEPGVAVTSTVATFLVAGVETYKILVTDAEDVAVLYRLRAGLPAPTIPNGLIVRGDPGVNEPWSWHIDPASLEFADFTIEVCDGLPSHVEDGTLTSDSYCPWSARLIAMDDPPEPAARAP
jgi:hypothetical protein